MTRIIFACIENSKDFKPNPLDFRNEIWPYRQNKPVTVQYLKSNGVCTS